MRAFLIGLFLFPATSFAAAEGLRVVYDIEFPSQTSQAGMTKVKGQYFIQEGAARFEMDSPDATLGPTVVIGKANPKKSYILFPNRKAYMEAPERDPKAPAPEAKLTTPFKPTGKSKEIAGYQCDVVSREVEDRKEEACTSGKLKKELKNLESVLPSPKGSQGALPNGMDGFPLEYQVTRLKAVKGQSATGMTMRVAEVKREKFASTLFEIPSGYQKQEMPAMDPAMMKEMSRGGKKGQQKLPPNLDEKLKEMKKMMQEQQKQQIEKP
jgi:hypothetical protein